MKKIILIITIIFWGGLLIANQNSKAETANVSLSADVMSSLAIMVDPGTINFGSLIAGNVSYGTGGVDIIVGTNSANGYELAISDGQLSGDSTLLNSGDMTTRIADHSSSIATPKVYEIGDKGLGFTLYAADTDKEAAWGTGNTFNSIDNKYAGIPENATVFHQSLGYKDINDHSYIGFMLDVPSTQKSGSYSGDIVLSATCVLE